MTAAQPAQLELWAEPVAEPFAFVACCHLCGARSEPIPAESPPGVWPADTWWSASCFALVALAAHEAECPGRST